MSMEHFREGGAETSMATVNGIRLAYEIHGTADIPLVMVHGSWLTRRTWDPIIPRLAQSFRVLIYDRRGHGDSERPEGQDSVHEDVADLAALIEYLGLAPVWVGGQSFGGSITLRLAAERPDLLQGIAVHEPPLFSLLSTDPSTASVLEEFERSDKAVAERIESGDHAGAAEQFVDAALGPGQWNQLPPQIRQSLIEQAPTYRDEVRDPDVGEFDTEWVSEFPHQVLLTKGDQSPPLFAPVVSEIAGVLPSAQVRTISRGGHFIQADQPEDYADAIISFIRRHSKS